MNPIFREKIVDFCLIMYIRRPNFREAIFSESEAESEVQF